MAAPDEVDRHLTWLRDGEARFLDQIGSLSDDDLAAPSALPEWTRAHVAAHVACNAEALCRLLSWARTGAENPMYTDLETRNRDIETTVSSGPDQIRTYLHEASARLLADLDAMPDPAWAARVRTFHGRDIPASFVVWMRVREVWLHLVDLGSGVLVASWPRDLIDALMDEVTATMSARDSPPSLLLEPSDRDRDWAIGPGSEAAAPGAGVDVRRTVRGRSADLLAWLTGRSAGEGLAIDGVLPELPPWM